MKKLIVFTLALVLFIGGTVNPVHASEPDNEYYEEKSEQLESLQKYNRIFIENGMINEFTLNENFELTTSKDFEELKIKYSLSDDDLAYVRELINFQNKSQQIKDMIPYYRFSFKNFRLYLTASETKSYLGTAAAAGPVAMAGALAALGTVVGGPAGSAISIAIGVVGSALICRKVSEATNKHKGIWIGWGGIGIY